MSGNLDLTLLSSEQKSERLISEFKALAMNEALVIQSNNSLKSALRELQTQFWKQFEWVPLVTGPEIWKGTLMKTKDSKAFGSFSDFMSRDHARCDQFYADGEAAVLDNKLEDASELLHAFALNLRRHFAMEERIAFPAFEKQTGMMGGPTQVMRMEHEQMLNTLPEIDEALDDQDYDTVLGIGETLLILMQQHNMKEENILYPMIDQHLSNAEEFIKLMQLME
ncbi:hemerythrin domain-containing protein [Deltaproteobacteria bacterium TL4]